MTTTICRVRDLKPRDPDGIEAIDLDGELAAFRADLSKAVQRYIAATIRWQSPRGFDPADVRRLAYRQISKELIRAAERHVKRAGGFRRRTG